MIQQIRTDCEKVYIASEILNNLPEWFGLPESTQNYIEECKHMPFWAAFVQNRPIGFIALKKTSAATAEIFVMGILKEHHHAGIGRELYHSFEAFARKQGCIFAQVKTVQMGHYAQYDNTNRFYQAMGFHELECFANLWDEWNPCQVYVKYIGG